MDQMKKNPEQQQQQQQGPRLDPEKVKQFQKGFGVPVSDNSDVMSRRMQMLNQQDPRIAVGNALGALAQMPDEYKKEYAPALIKTQMALEKGRV